MTNRFPLVLVPLLALSACTTPGSPGTGPGSVPATGMVETTPPADGGSATGDPAGACDAAAARSQVGTLATPAVIEQARLVAGARNARTLAPGQMRTLEFRADRLNLLVDEDNRIVRLQCG